MCGSRKTRVSASASAAVSDRECLPRACEINDFFAGVGIVNHRPDRHRHFYVLAFAAGAIAAFAMAAPLRVVLRVVSQMKECVRVFARQENNITAPAAIAAARTTSGNTLLAPERKTAVTAIT